MECSTSCRKGGGWRERERGGNGERRGGRENRIEKEEGGERGAGSRVRVEILPRVQEKEEVELSIAPVRL